MGKKVNVVFSQPLRHGGIELFKQNLRRKIRSTLGSRRPLSPSINRFVGGASQLNLGGMQKMDWMEIFKWSVFLTILAALAFFVLNPKIRW